uniref:Uncharacterized protein n=1 Tax=Glossina palpalis gambiensis TaxID=67801 RepID=A0A1B0BAR1_9MUSC
MLRDTTTTQFKEDVNIIKMEVFIFENNIWWKIALTYDIDYKHNSIQEVSELYNYDPFVVSYLGAHYPEKTNSCMLYVHTPSYLKPNKNFNNRNTQFIKYLINGLNSVEHGELYDDKWLRVNITILIALNDFPFRSMRLRHSILSPAAISNFPIMQLLYYHASLVLFTFKNGGHLLKK